MTEQKSNQAIEPAVYLYTMDDNGHTHHGSGAVVQGQEGKYIGSVAHNALDVSTGEVQPILADEKGVYYFVGREGYFGIARAVPVQLSSMCESASDYQFDHMTLEILSFEEAQKIYRAMVVTNSFDNGQEDEAFKVQVNSLVQRLETETGVLDIRAIMSEENGFVTPHWYMTNTPYFYELEELNKVDTMFDRNEKYIVGGFAGSYREEQLGEDGIRRPTIRECNLTSLNLNEFTGEEESVSYACVQENQTLADTVSPGTSGAFTESVNPETGETTVRAVHNIFIEGTNTPSANPEEEVPVYRGRGVSIKVMYDQIKMFDDARVAGDSDVFKLKEGDSELYSPNVLVTVCQQPVHITELPRPSDTPDVPEHIAGLISRTD